jgi:hypothetical protein
MLIAEFVQKLQAYPTIGQFLAWQIAADVKPFSALRSAPDYQTAAGSGPGSRPGMNLIMGRPEKASWRERDWYQRLAELFTLIEPIYRERGLPIPDYQDLQHQLCEGHKYLQMHLGLKTRLKREYKPAVERPPKPPKPPKPIKAPSERKRMSRKQETVAETVVTVDTAPGSPSAIPDYILADLAPETSQPESKPKEDTPQAKRKPITHQIDFATDTLPPALAPLALQSRWVCWRWEWRKGKWTKPPIQPGNGQYARNNDPTTWGTYEEAVKRVAEDGTDGVGYCLLGVDIGAVDLDDCRSRGTGAIAEWAQEMVRRAPEGTYCEVTVSGEGLRLIGATAGFPMQHKFPAAEGGSFELYRRTARYITVSGQAIGGASGPLPNIDDLLDELLAEAGQRAAEARGETPQPALGGKWARGGMTEKLFALITDGVGEGERSEQFFTVVAQLKRLGWSVNGMVELFGQHPGGIAEKYGGRLRTEVERAFRKAIARDIGLGDFYAYMPQHQYYFAPTRQMWPGSSVNSRFPGLVVLSDGNLVCGESGKPIKILASQWLDQNRPIEALTWAPGEPLLVPDRLMVDTGWLDKPGTTTLNQYLPPIIWPGDSRRARPWLRLVFKVFGPADGKHIIRYLAFKAQFPAAKINHGLLLGGAPGIGKDTILEPARLAVGEWNFQEASPRDMLGSFNPFTRAVILRISEIRDLGEASQYAFYDHMKQYLAAPPNALPTNEKYIKQYHVANVCGVIFTTNYKENGLYLPFDDRRHYVAWSERVSADFAPGYWQEIWDWYADGGCVHVTALLRKLSLTKFKAKADAPKTAAFRAIAAANTSPEQIMLDDVLEAMGRPLVVTWAMIKAHPNLPQELFDWLKSRSLRVPTSHLDKCGYASVANPDAANDLWRIGGIKQMTYVLKDVPEAERIRVVRQFISREKARKT